MLVVTGPPRSGTSLVCNLLQGLGCDFGPEEKLIPGNRWNELGYFENTDIVAMNHQLILGSWVDSEPWTVSVWPDSRIERLRRLVVLALGRATMTQRNIQRRSRKKYERLEALQAQYADCTVKDPRFCFTLPAWGDSVKGVLFCIRHPREIADSMAAQSGFSRAIGYYAYHRWTRWFFRHDHPYPVSWVDYNRLISQEGFEGEMRRLYAFMGRPFDPDEARAVQARTVRTDLHHNRADLRDLPFPVRWAYEDLLRRHRESEPIADVEPLRSDRSSGRRADTIQGPDAGSAIPRPVSGGSGRAG